MPGGPRPRDKSRPPPGLHRILRGQSGGSFWKIVGGQVSRYEVLAVRLLAPRRYLDLHFDRGALTILPRCLSDRLILQIERAPHLGPAMSVNYGRMLVDTGVVGNESIGLSERNNWAQ